MPITDKQREDIRLLLSLLDYPEEKVAKTIQKIDELDMTEDQLNKCINNVKKLQGV